MLTRLTGTTCLCLFLAPACGGTSSGEGGSTSITAGSASDGSASDGSASAGTDDSDSTSASGSASDSTSGTSGGTDGGGTGGTPFLSEPDGGGPMNECDVWMQDCPDDEKCMPWAATGGNFWDGLKCTPVDPNPKQPGDECTAEGNGLSGIDDCALGSMCWNVSGETGTGICVELCGGAPASPTCSDPSAQCSVAHDGVLPLCLTACDPVVQDCPVEADSCVLTADGGFKCEPNQAGTGGSYGEPCEFTNVCQEGLFCLSGSVIAGCNDPFCCTAFCDVTDPLATDNCPGKDLGDECIPWYEAGQAPPGMEHVGFCGLPQ